MKLSPDKAIAKIMPLLFVSLWSTGFIGAKFGLPYAGALTFLSLRYSLVVAIMLIFLGKNLIREIQKIEHPFHVAVSGILIHAVYLGGTFISIGLGMEAGYASAIVSLQPMLTALVAGFWIREKLGIGRLAGLLLGVAGVYMLLSNKTSGDIPVFTQALPVIVALFALSAGTVYQKRFCGNFGLRSGFIIQYSASFLLTFPAALIFEDNTIDFTPSFIFALVWLTFVLSLGTITLMYKMLQHRGVVRTVSWFYLTPVLASLQGVVFFNEDLTGLALTGMAVTVLGVYLGNREAGTGKK